MVRGFVMTAKIDSKLEQIWPKNDFFHCGSVYFPMYPGDLKGALWLILTGIRSRIAQKYTPPPPSSVWGMPGHKWHIHARP